MPTQPRILPQRSDEWSDDAKEMFAFFEGPEAREKGSVSNVMLTFAHHPKLMFAFSKFSGRLLARPRLAPRLREILILRVALRFKSDYEWVQHLDLGREVGLGPEHFEAVKVGPDDSVWSDLERHALRAADQMMNEYKIDDSTWNALASELDTQQMFELLMIVGIYSGMAWVYNSIGVQPEPGAGQGNTNYLAKAKPDVAGSR
jgi:4-carboxymuconolactone decarboxylase